MCIGKNVVLPVTLKDVNEIKTSKCEFELGCARVHLQGEMHLLQICGVKCNVYDYVSIARSFLRPRCGHGKAT
jgi:hypothetical protein